MPISQLPARFDAPPGAGSDGSVITVLTTNFSLTLNTSIVYPKKINVGLFKITALNGTVIQVI